MRIAFIGSLIPVLFFSSIANGAVVLKCSKNKLASTHHCIISFGQQELVQLGDSVVAYKEGSYWAGTGSVISKKGRYAMVTFSEYFGIIHRGMQAKIYRSGAIETTDWQQAFSNNESSPYR